MHFSSAYCLLKPPFKVVSMPQSTLINANRSGPSSQPQYPRLLISEDIAALLRLSNATILHYTSNKKKFGHLLPVWFKLPGHRRNYWLETTVHEFLHNGHNAAVALTVNSVPKRRGRPTKSEQIAKERSAAIVTRPIHDAMLEQQPSKPKESVKARARAAKEMAQQGRR